MVSAPVAVDEPPAETAWDQRPIVGRTRGLPWWGAVLLAFGMAAIAAWVDMNRQDSLGRIYQGTYVLGCVVAVCAVRRRNLFGPMVQPPLVFAVTAIGAVVLSQPGPLFSSGLKQLVFSVALPLTSNFPTMAITTGVTVAIGLLRLGMQRNPNPRVHSSRSARDPLDEREPRPTRAADPAPSAGRPQRSRPDRQRSGRSRTEDPPPARRGARGGGRPEAGDNWDQPPRSGRGHTDADRGARGRATPPPDRRARGDQRRAERPPQDQPRRPTRRRPPDSDYR